MRITVEIFSKDLGRFVALCDYCSVLVEVLTCRPSPFVKVELTGSKRMLEYLAYKLGDKKIFVLWI